MTETVIQNLYNKLAKWESKKAIKPYPIHKKLAPNSFGYNDIYQWISKTYNLNNKKILDAGCGVGYGAIYLSKQFNCKVTGISLSDTEIEKANTFAKTEKANNHVVFNRLSYDNLPQNTYDFIMAIESVKHTLNIKTTLKSLKNALKPNGTLIIVDDFLFDKHQNRLITKYAKDWSLKEILDFDMFLPSFKIKKDLTPYFKTKKQATLTLGIFLCTILKPFYNVAIIMRGGFYLEKILKTRLMKYCVIEYKND